VTDRSHHWIRAIFRHIMPGLKCFGGIPRRMPFLGAETALPCVGGRGLAISPSLAWRPIRAGFLVEEIPGNIARVLPVRDGRLEDSRERKPARSSRPRLRAVFRRNGTEKVHVWYGNTP
jgi:hypothetical protein